jgi:alkylated DNA nucleotide flippase Atl1
MSPTVQHIHREAVLPGELAGLIGKMAGGADVARQVAEILGELDSGGDRLTLRKCLLCQGQFVAATDAEGQFAQRTADLVLF